MPKAIKSLTGYVKKIESLRRNTKNVLFFRGHSDVDFTLLPSVMRNDNLKKSERNIIYDLMAEAPNDFERDRFHFDKLVRAQHYGAPTRLLDITANPLMALYFACELSPHQRGQVLVFEAPATAPRYFLSDTVSCKANISQLSHEEQIELREKISEAAKEAFNGFKRIVYAKLKRENPVEYSDFVKIFNDKPITKRLVQFVRDEKPHFTNSIDPLSLFTIDAVIPKKSNQRIIAQTGAFLLFGLHETVTSDSTEKIITSAIDISQESKADILKALSAIDITKHRVYPEIQNITDVIKKRYS